jgi:hypothetical protein
MSTPTTQKPSLCLIHQAYGDNYQFDDNFKPQPVHSGGNLLQATLNLNEIAWWGKAGLEQNELHLQLRTTIHVKGHVDGIGEQISLPDNLKEKLQQLENNVFSFLRNKQEKVSKDEKYQSYTDFFWGCVNTQGILLFSEAFLGLCCTPIFLSSPELFTGFAVIVLVSQVALGILEGLSCLLSPENAESVEKRNRDFQQEKLRIANEAGLFMKEYKETLASNENPPPSAPLLEARD